MIYERKYETESIYSDERASNDTEDADSSLKNSTKLWGEISHSNADQSI